MEALLQLLLIPRRFKFRRNLRRTQPASEALIATLRARCEEARLADWKAYYGLYNAGLFIALLNRDIATYNESIFFARSAWHRQFHARNLAVLLYEVTEDLPQLLGKEYRTWLTDIGIGQEWLNSLGKITSEISRFKVNHSTFLKEVRNYIGAHREHDSLSQLAILDSFDALAVYKLAGELFGPIRDLAAFNTRLLGYMHNPAVMIVQACREVDRA